MRREWICAIVLGCAVLTARADDSSPAKATDTPTFDALKAEFDAAKKAYSEASKKRADEYRKALDEAEGKDAKAAVTKKYTETLRENPSPLSGFAPRFLAFATKNPEAKEAADALYLALRNSGGPLAKSGVYTKTFEAIRDQGYSTKPEVRPLLRTLAYSGNDAAMAFVREVIAKNPDRKTQALAVQALATYFSREARSAEMIERNATARAASEKRLGKEKVDEQIAKGKVAKKEAEELTALVKSKYSDVLPDLSIGNLAPEVVLQDLEGKQVKLSELKGKVVVLDFWATWCGPCKAMIPHERAMTEHLRDKPFVLVSISADEEKQTVVDFLTKTPMPWTHWWNGDKGGVLDNWNVTAFPTIVVLDANGTIRFKDLRDKALEAAVEKLLGETESKK